MNRFSDIVSPEVQEALRRQAAEVDAANEGGISLDTSPEAKNLPLTTLGEGKVRLNTIDLVEVKPEDIRQAEAYQSLKQMYEAGELEESDLQEVFADEPSSSRLLEKIFVPEAKGRTHVSPDKDAAVLLLQDIENGLVPRQVKVSRSVPGFRLALSRGVERPEAEQQLWRELCQEYTKGMSLEAMADQYLKGGADKELVRRFLQEVQQGKFDPAAFLMTEVLLAQPKLPSHQLEQQDWEQVSHKLLEATRAVWQDFAYGGKWKYDKQTGHYSVADDADLDAKTSLYLLKLAGIADNIKTAAVPPGEFKPQATTIDSGKKSGVVVNNQTVIIDNHQPSRGYETSSAKILYRLLRAANLLDGQDEALAALVEMSVDDDNGRLLNTRAQFEHSDHSLRGLQRYMSADKVHSFFKAQLPKAEAKLKNNQTTPGAIEKRDIYHKALNHQLSEAELKSLGLNKWKRKNTDRYIGAEYWQAESIRQAKDWFLQNPGQPDSPLKSDKELMDDGRLIVGQVAGQAQRWAVNIVGLEDKLRAGHDAVTAYGFDGLISYNPEQHSFMVNTTNDQVDLSKDLHLQQGVPVRGAMWIKPMNGQPLTIDLVDILKAVGVNEDYLKNPQGLIKDYMELERLIKAEEVEIRQGFEAQIQSAEYAGLSAEDKTGKLNQLVRETMSEIRRQVYNEYKKSKSSSESAK